LVHPARPVDHCNLLVLSIRNGSIELKLLNRNLPFTQSILQAATEQCSALASMLRDLAGFLPLVSVSDVNLH